MIRLRRFVPVAVVVVAVLAVVFAPSALRWRTQIVVLKAIGQLPELPWDEVIPLIRPGSLVWAEALATTPSPSQVLAAPSSSEDLAAGRRIFETHCVSCHGPDGRGVDGTAGGDLTSGHFKYGASDWALYRTLRTGIAGTSMLASDLDVSSTWQVVGHVRRLVSEANPYRTPREEANSGADADTRRVTFADLRRARESGEWLTFSGAYDGQRRSPLTQIDRTTVAGLGVRWIVQLPTDREPLAVTPLVAGGTMFVNLPFGDVVAIDAGTGSVRWRHERRDRPAVVARSVEGHTSQGMAILDDTLYVATVDARLIAIDARTGERRWNVEVADFRGGAGYSVIGAPLAVDGRVIVGVAGGDRGVRGFLDAYAVADGRRVWRFETIPGEAEPGHETWGSADAWRRGGGLTPITGAYDAELGLVYWGVGNPSPAFNGDLRPGDNLYTSSIVAVDAASGQLRWHYQVAPHDEWEYGVTHVPVLADATNGDGRIERLLHVASRNGFLYTLDRETGRFVRATPFARQTWNAGFDDAGRPIERPHVRPSTGGTFGYPGHAGATYSWPPSYDPATGIFYVVTRDGYANTFYKDHRLTWPDGAFWGGRAAGVAGVSVSTEVRAVEAGSGSVRWTYRFPGTVTGLAGGVLSTAGGLVFAGEKQRFVAIDATTGAELWHFSAGGAINAAPISYQHAGRQFVAIAAGGTLLVFSLAE